MGIWKKNAVVYGPFNKSRKNGVFPLKIRSCHSIKKDFRCIEISKKEFIFVKLYCTNEILCLNDSLNETQEFHWEGSCQVIKSSIVPIIRISILI